MHLHNHNQRATPPRLSLQLAARQPPFSDQTSGSSGSFDRTLPSWPLNSVRKQESRAAGCTGASAKTNQSSSGLLHEFDAPAGRGRAKLSPPRTPRSRIQKTTGTSGKPSSAATAPSSICITASGISSKSSKQGENLTGVSESGSAITTPSLTHREDNCKQAAPGAAASAVMSSQLATSIPDTFAASPAGHGPSGHSNAGDSCLVPQPCKRSLTLSIAPPPRPLRLHTVVQNHSCPLQVTSESPRGFTPASRTFVTVPPILRRPISPTPNSCPAGPPLVQCALPLTTTSSPRLLSPGLQILGSRSSGAIQWPGAKGTMGMPECTDARPPRHDGDTSPPCDPGRRRQRSVSPNAQLTLPVPDQAKDELSDGCLRFQKLLGSLNQPLEGLRSL